MLRKPAVGIGLIFFAVLAPATLRAQVTITPTTLPQGLNGNSYGSVEDAQGFIVFATFPRLVSTGGVAPYTYTVTGGSLPPGLTLESDGRITGFPTTNGDFPFTATARDNGSGATGFRAFTIQVVSRPGQFLLIDNNVGNNPIYTRLPCTGRPYVYFVFSGALPPGLAIDPATGTVTGVLTTAGTYAYYQRCTATDGSGFVFTTKEFRLTVRPKDRVTAAPAFTGSAYNFSGLVGRWVCAGGCQVTVAQGTIPAGLVVDAVNARITGTSTATGAFTFTVRFTSTSGAFFVTDVSLSVLNPALSLSRNAITLMAPAGGAPVSASVDVSGSAPGQAYTVSASTTTGVNWLRATPPNGLAPDRIDIVADPATLAAGDYTGAVTVASPGAPNQQVGLTFSVAAPAAPDLRLDPANLIFTSRLRGRPEVRSAALRNFGSGAAAFTVAVRTTTGGNWLSAGADRNQTPATLLATADPGVLAANTYSGFVLISSGGRTLELPVSMALSAVQRTLALSQNGLTFVAAAGSRLEQTQPFQVLNAGETGTINWTAVTSIENGGPGWLAATPAAGSSTESPPHPSVTIRINPAGLEPGQYYGTVQVSTPDAENSPQVCMVLLTVLAAGVTPSPNVSPTGLVFVGAPGGQNPNNQVIQLTNIAGQSINYTATPIFPGSRVWFTVAPVAASLTPGTPFDLTVQPNLAGLAAGVYPAQLLLSFVESRTTARLDLVLVVAPGATRSAAPSLQREAGPPREDCMPGRLVVVATRIFSGFTTSVGWPVPLEARVLDDCGQSLTAGAVDASFSGGEPPLVFASLRDGRWSGTWSPRNSNNATLIITVKARRPGPPLLEGQAVIGGVADTSATSPVLSGAPVSAVSFASGPVARGGLIALFGGALADGLTVAPSLPLPEQLATTQAVLGGRRLPLQFSSGGQVNGVVPFDVPANTTLPLIVRRGQRLSTPEPVTIADLQPAIFSKAGTGRGQALIVRVAQDLSQSLAEPGTPATAGEVLVIYATGLGPLDPPIPAGSAAPDSPLSQTVSQVKVLVGGVEAQVFFAGAAPGFAALYQVNALVPAGVAPGDTVPVTLELGGQTSPPVTIAIR